MTQRTIALSGADNARDLGGLASQNGRIIRKGKLVRANALEALTEADVQLLREQYALGLIIDLRTLEEVAEKPDVRVPGAQWSHMPVFSSSAVGITHEKKADKELAMLEALPDLGSLYAYMVTHANCQAQFARILKTICGHEGGALLWHCTAGKDRCGLVSVLVLSLLDVDEQTIREDYLLTNVTAWPRAEAFSEMVLAKTGSMAMAEKARNAFVADERYLDAALDAIRALCKGLSAYTERVLGISSEEKQRFQARILE